MISVYPQHKEKLQVMEIEGYGLVHSKSVPKIDVLKSAAVVIGSQISTYFTKKEEKNLFWNYLEKITEEGEEKIKRKVNRFKANLRSECDFEIPQI
jgi:tryptophan synthase alpha subunit